MTNTELKYYTALQPFFQEKMGPWQIGDPYICLKHPRKIQGIKESPIKYIEWEDTYGKIEPCCPDALRLLLPIDPENPERGLLGMIKGHFQLEYDGMKWMLRKPSFDVPLVVADTPTGAVLKALAAQEGVLVNHLTDH